MIVHLHARARPVPLSAILAAIPSLPRPVLARLVERAIDHLDTTDGDPDIEANGDELDGENSEDAFGRTPCNVGIWAGPGCPIADDDSGVDDTGELDDEREPDDAY